MDQAIFDGDECLVGDARQQFHIGLGSDSWMPSDRNLFSGTDTRLDPGFFGGSSNGFADQFRFQFDRLICFGNTEFKRGDPHGGDIHVQAFAFRSSPDTCRQFDLNLVFACRRNQQRIGTVSRSAE